MRGPDRLISVMDVIADYGPASLTEISGLVGLPKPTVLRLLRALDVGGWVARDDASLYRTGPRVLSLAHRYLDGEAVLRIASPFMLRLRDDVDETVSLIARSGNHRVCIQEFVSSEPLKVTHGVGSLAPLAESPASGLLLLAFADAVQRAHIAAQAPPRTTLHKWVTTGVLERRCAEVREQGWTISSGERGEGASAVVAALRHPLTGETYALGVFCPEGRFVAAHDHQGWVDIVQRCAAEIQLALEGPSHPADGRREPAKARRK